MNKSKFMRWKNFSLLLGILLIYTTFPLIIAHLGGTIATIYGCTDRYTNAQFTLSPKLQCGENYDLAHRLEGMINMVWLSLLTIPTGKLAITLLVVVQIIRLLLKFLRNRNRSNQRSSH